MFDRFTDYAKGAMNKARQQSQRLNHEYLGTEHILLGLLDEEGCRARSILESLQISPSRLRSEIDTLVRPGLIRANLAALPFTPRARKALEYMMDEAGALGARTLGTEHLLLGLAREPEGVASKALSACGLSVENARALARGMQGPEDNGGRADQIPRGSGDHRSEAWRVRILEDAFEVLIELEESELAAKVRELARKHGSRK